MKAYILAADLLRGRDYGVRGKGRLLEPRAISSNCAILSIC